MMMKRLSFTVLLLSIMHGALCIEIHHDWEDNHVLQINREPARAYFIPYGVKTGDRTLSLNVTGISVGRKRLMS